MFGDRSGSHVEDFKEVLSYSCIGDDDIETAGDFSNGICGDLYIGIGSRFKLQDVDIWMVRCKVSESVCFAWIADTCEDRCIGSLCEDLGNLKAYTAVGSSDEI